MFLLDQDYQDAINNLPDGKIQADKSDVYDAHAYSDDLGGQTWSEIGQFQDIYDAQAARINELTGETLQLGETEMGRLLRSEPQKVDLTVPAKEATTGFDGYINRLNGRLQELQAQYPEENFQTLSGIQETIAVKARKAWDAALEVSSRADGFDRFVGEMGAGATQGLSEPMNYVAVVATAPIAVETLAGGLLMKLGQLAAIEATASGGSEAVIQTQLKDYYRRQGFQEDEINDRVKTNIIGATIGGGVLAPIGYGIGKGIGKGLSKLGIFDAHKESRIIIQSIEKIQSGDARLAREGFAELKKIKKFSPEEKADIANAEKAFDLQEKIGGTTPDEVRANARTIDDLVNDFQYGTARTPAEFRQQLLNGTARILDGAPDVTKARIDAEPDILTYKINDQGIVQNVISTAKGAHTVIDRTALNEGVEIRLKAATIKKRLAKAEQTEGSVFADVDLLKDQRLLAMIAEAKTQKQLVEAIQTKVNSIAQGESATRLTNRALKDLGFEAIRETNVNKVKLDETLNAPTVGQRASPEVPAVDDVAPTATRTGQPTPTPKLEGAPEPTKPAPTITPDDAVVHNAVESEARSIIERLHHSDLDEAFKKELFREYEETLEAEKALQEVIACMG